MAVPTQQIILGSCCNCGSFQLYFGGKVWRGQQRWPKLCGQTRGDTLYLGLAGNLSTSGGASTVYHGTQDHFGNGPPDPTMGSPFTLDYTDDGSSPPLSTGSYAGPFPGPFSSGYVGGFLRCSSGYVDPFNVHFETLTTLSDTSYVASIDNPSIPVHEADLSYVLSAPYAQTDVLAEAITVARGATVTPGQGGVSSYQEDQGAMNNPDVLFPFVRSSFAMANSMWNAGWGGLNENITNAKPWTGAQVHNVYSAHDAGDCVNLDGTLLGLGNPHQAYLVSFANKIREGIGVPNLITVLSSTFSGSGALATYETNPDPRQFWPKKISCVDIVASNMTLDPTFPSDSVIVGGVLSQFRWQIFFPGKLAASIPDPSFIWDGSGVP